MKYYPRLNLYKNATGTNCFNPETKEAYSYHWWRYVEMINGKWVFNNYSFSPTTCKHQSNMLGVLDAIKAENIVFIEAPKGLQDLPDSIRYYEHKIIKLTAEIARPKSQKRKNQKRQTLICEYQYKIKLVKTLILRTKRK